MRRRSVKESLTQGDPVFTVLHVRRSGSAEATGEERSHSIEVIPQVVNRPGPASPVAGLKASSRACGIAAATQMRDRCVEASAEK